MENYIEDKKNLYTLILKFLEEPDESNNDKANKETFQNLINVIKSQQIEENCEENRQFLETIKSIGENHHRNNHFNEGMSLILEHYKEQIIQTYSNLEIFNLFESNKKIVLFLLKKGIITISDEIYRLIINKIENNGNRYCYFFITELEKFVGVEKMKFVKDELLKEDPNFFTNYEEKREEGENDSYICSLIRQDSVEDFISHMSRYNISPLSQISPSIFETNPFLIDNKNTTLIEYSAFFGSIQIYQYLLMNNAKLTPSLWLYVIHSNNAELIHRLESSEVPHPKPKNNEKEKEYVFEEEEEFSYEEEEEFLYEKEEEVNDDNSYYNNKQCLIESIKCHHNDIADYIKNNSFYRNKNISIVNEEIISNYLQYHNYSNFQTETIIDYGFFYLCLYHYVKLVKLFLLNQKKKIIQCSSIINAAQKKSIDAIYYYLLKVHTIQRKFFEYTYIKKISIPPTVTSIGKYAFFECSSLKQILIPSSLTSIEDFAFYGCISITQISIPPSVTSIGPYVFSMCRSLKRITFESPSSVALIGDKAFFNCLSLKKISIPPSVNSIGKYAFAKCFSLRQINFENSSLITSIGEYAFTECQLLKQIAIPPSITSIEKWTFAECKSLKKISIPSSVKSIGEWAFHECSSLAHVTFEVTSSVTSIGEYAFSRCYILKKITIPSSVTLIGKHSFKGCPSIIKKSIPSSIEIYSIQRHNHLSDLNSH